MENIINSKIDLAVVFCACLIYKVILFLTGLESAAGTSGVLPLILVL